MSAPAYVITGGTGALGAAVVRAVAEGGARVAVPYRRRETWDALRASLPTAPLWGMQVDMSDPADAARFTEDAVAWLGGLNGLAVVAGGYRGSGTLEEAPVEEWTSMLSANLSTAYAACRAALPHLLPHGGSVVTVAARLALEGGAGAAAYAVSKAGVVALTRVLAAENRQRGVRFNCVLPAIIDTDANRQAMPEGDRRMWASPTAVARIIAFLLSDESAALSGAVLPVDFPA